LLFFRNKLGFLVVIVHGAKPPAKLYSLDNAIVANGLFFLLQNRHSGHAYPLTPAIAVTITYWKR
jgi:hypothetical protein